MKELLTPKELEIADSFEALGNLRIQGTLEEVLHEIRLLKKTAVALAQVEKTRRYLAERG